MDQNLMIETSLLRQLIRSGRAGELVAKGVPGGFVLAVREGLDDELLGTQRGGARRFRRLEAVASYLKSLGAGGFKVELARWTDKGLV